MLADYGITDPQAIAEIQRRIKAGEPIDKVLADVLGNQNLINLQDKNTKQQLAKLANKDIQEQIAKRIANGEKLEDILQDLGITDPQIAAEIKRRIANGESLDAVLQGLGNLPSNSYNPAINPILQEEVTKRLEKGENIANVLANINNY